ncbi:MAG: hypothetical protein MUP02_00030 [Actinobacteria bacterium]|nr:hypothetical protein [Actinomycetota bacterium]
MSRKLFFIKVLAVTVTFMIMLGFIPFMSSCTPQIKFGELTVSGEIDAVTGEPVGSKDEFSFNIKKVFTTIKVSGVKADDNKRFTIVNEDTGEIIFDKTEKYSIKDTGFIEAYFYVETEDLEEGQVLLDPGKYYVSFYHNGELKDTADFKIIAPAAEIIEVKLSNEDSDNMELVNPTSEFSPSDGFFIYVLTNFLIIGDVYSIRWYFDDDEILDVVDIEITENYYGQEVVNFWYPPKVPWKPGSYKAEVYLNSSLYSKYDFIVVGEEEVPQKDGSYFTQGNIYINEDYGYSINYPDGWDYKEEYRDGHSVTFFPVSDDISMFTAVSWFSEGAFDPNNFEIFSEDYLFDITGESEWNIEAMEIYSEGEEIYSGELSGLYQWEYFYSLTDQENNNYAFDNILLLKVDDLIMVSGLFLVRQAAEADEILKGMWGSISFE